MVTAQTAVVGATTAIVYDWRVGTSIWESAERTSNNPRTTVRLGEKAARMRQMLDGMCV